MLIGYSVLLVVLLTPETRSSSVEASVLADCANYTISSSGVNKQDCLSGHAPCATLEYVMGKITGLNCVSIVIDSSLNLTEKISLKSPKNFLLAGSRDSIIVTCINESGLLYENPQNVSLKNLTFSNCAMQPDVINVNAYSLTDYAAVYFHKGSNVQVTGCSFENGRGTGLIMHDVMGINSVEWTNFLQNRPKNAASNLTHGGMIVKRQDMADERASYTISYCNFNNNENLEIDDGRGLGGGLSVCINGSTNSSTEILIIHTNFCGNNAIQGGGLLVNLSDSSSSLSLNITSTMFHGNHAEEQGGGILFDVYEACSHTNSALIMNYANFSNNSARWGGGLSVYKATKTANLFIMAHQSMWNTNNANDGGLGVALYQETYGVTNALPSNLTMYSLNGRFTECQLWYNSNIGYYKSLTGYGVLYLRGARADINDCTFRHNRGTAFFLQASSYATFGGNTSFEFNEGVHSGAIYIDEISVMALISGVSLSFSNNYAFFSGGAIYIKSNTLSLQNGVCVFESLHKIVNSVENRSVTFYNNSIHNELQSIYVGNPSDCMAGANMLLNNSKIFSYDPNLPSQIMGPGIMKSLDFSPKMNNNTQLEVMLGEKFHLIPTVQDVFNNSAYIKGTLILENRFYKHINYNLIGPQYLYMNNFTQITEFYITGSMSDVNMKLVFYYPGETDYHDNKKMLDIVLVPCRIGFVYNESTQVCVCTPENNFLCDSTMHQYACVRYGYWYGLIEHRNETTVLPCPGGNCYYANGGCPGTRCPNAPNFCRLNKTDDLCWYGRSGILCSECKLDYSFTFGGLSCVKSSTCKASNTALIMLGVITCWVFFVIIILVILSLNLSIGSGFMYGLVYYFSIVPLFTDNVITDQFLETVVSTCVALTQLCPRAFGDIKVCFAESWNLNLHHKIFHYVTPLFITGVILAVITFTRYFRCPKRLSLAQNSPIHAICMLVLFSYTSLAYTSFGILKPLHMNGKLWVYIDPKIRYFSGEHAPYALVALFFEVVILLPICFLLLLAPCLSRCVNLVKLRLMPILDEFQACYRPECRWFAGFYFLARQLVYLASIIYANELPGYNSALQYVNALTLIAHSFFQPYKSRWLNILDTLFLIDIFLISFFHADSTFNFLHKVTPYILILLPALYLLGVILVLFYKRFHFLFSCCSKLKKLQKTTEGALPSSTSAKIDGDTEGISSSHGAAPRRSEFSDQSFFEDYGEREPLLSETDSECSSYSEKTHDGIRSRAAFTTSSLKVSVLDRFPPHPVSTNKPLTN